MSSIQLLEFFEHRRAAGTALVMVTVIETTGSTYSKAGHRILIDESGDYYGLVSGGCLEGDLVEHAREVFSSRRPKVVVYDLRGDEDELWGLGIGCNGILRLLFQLVDKENDFEPMRSIARLFLDPSGGELTLVTGSEHQHLAVGTTLFGASQDLESALITSTVRVAPGVEHSGAIVDGQPMQLLRQIILPIPRILILGAGPDAVPLVTGCQSLGWHVTVADHRSQFVSKPEFGSAHRLCWPDDSSVEEGLRDGAYTATVIMSHNLQADARYLRQLAPHNIPYIGLLGPAPRRSKLLDALEPSVRAQIQERIHSPVGMTIGADSPASIALAILAELFVELKKRSVPAHARLVPAQDAKNHVA